MPESLVTTPDGQQYRVTHPEGASQEDIFSFVQSQYDAPLLSSPDLSTPFSDLYTQPQEPLEEEEDKSVGVFDAIGFGVDQLQHGYGQAAEAIGKTTGYEPLEKFGSEYMEEQEEEMAEYGPLFTRFKDVDDFSSFLTYAKEGIAKQAPNIAAMGAASLAGAKAGSYFGPLGAFAGSIIAPAVAVSAPQLFDENIYNQEEAIRKGLREEIDYSDALVAAIGQSALDTLQFRIMFGLKPGKMFTGNVFTRAAKGAATGGVTEAPTEVAQDLISRLQAGLPLDDPEAIESYKESAAAGGLVGGFYGGAAHTAFGNNDEAKRQALREAQEKKEAELRQTQEEYFQNEREKLSEQIAKGQQDLYTPNTDPLDNKTLLSFKPPRLSENVRTENATKYAQEISKSLGDRFPSTIFTSLEETTVPSAKEGETETKSMPSLVVRDAEGRQYGRALKTEDEAKAVADALNKQVIQKRIADSIDIGLDIDGVDRTNPNRANLHLLGNQTLNPESNAFHALQINEAAGITEDSHPHATLSSRAAAKTDIPIEDLTPVQRYNMKRRGKANREQFNFTPKEARRILTEEQFNKLLDLTTTTVPVDTVINSEAIQQVLNEKNIDAKVDSIEFYNFVDKFLGKRISKDGIDALSDSEKRLIYKRLTEAPSFPEPTSLPSFAFKPYLKGQYEVAANHAIQAREVISKEALDALPFGEITDKAYKALSKDISTLLADRQNKGLLLDPFPKQTREQKRLEKIFNNTMKGYGLKDISVKVTSGLRMAKQDAEGNIYFSGPELKEYAYYNQDMKAIFVSLDNISNTFKGKKLTGANLREQVLDVLDHEIIHPMMRLDLFTQEEKSLLEYAVRNTMSPHKDKDGNQLSYAAAADAAYPELNAVNRMEEAIAEYTRDGLRGRIGVKAKPKSLLNRIVRFLQQLIGFRQKTGHESFDQLFRSIAKGEIGARERGQIRTLQATERVRGTVPERGIFGTKEEADAGRTPDFTETAGDAAFARRGVEDDEFERTAGARAAYRQTEDDRATRNKLVDDIEKIGVGGMSGMSLQDIKDSDLKDVSPETRRLIRAFRKEDYYGYESPDELFSQVFDYGIESIDPNPPAGLKAALGRYVNVNYGVAADQPAFARKFVPIGEADYLNAGLSQKEVDALVLAGDTQRGEPERVMLAVQNRVGGSPLNVVVEHLGDLINRFSPLHSISFTVGETIPDKLQGTVLPNLRSGYGFAKDSYEAILYNIKSDGVNPEERFREIQKVLSKYGEAHKKIPIFNDIHKLIQEATVLVSEMFEGDAPAMFPVGEMNRIKKLRSKKELRAAGYSDQEIEVLRSSATKVGNRNLIFDLPREDYTATDEEITQAFDFIDSAQEKADKAVDLLEEVERRIVVTEPNGYEIDFNRTTDNYEKEMSKVYNLSQIDEPAFARDMDVERLAELETKRAITLSRIKDATIEPRPNDPYRRSLERELEQYNVEIEEIKARQPQKTTEETEQQKKDAKEGIANIRKALSKPDPDAPAFARDVEKAVLTYFVPDNALIGQELESKTLYPDKRELFRRINSNEMKDLRTLLNITETANWNILENPFTEEDYRYVEEFENAYQPLNEKLNKGMERDIGVKSPFVPHENEDFIDNLLERAGENKKKYSSELKKGLLNGDARLWDNKEYAELLIEEGYDSVWLNLFDNKTRYTALAVLGDQSTVEVDPNAPAFAREYTGFTRSDIDPQKVEEVVNKNLNSIKEARAGYVPRFSAKASPEAQYIAQNPEVAQEIPEWARVQFSRNRPADIDPELQTLLKNVIDETVERRPAYDIFMEATGQSKFHHTVQQFRQGFVTRYSQLEWLNRNTVLRDNLADTSSIAAALFSDRSRGLAAAAIRYGAPIYRGGITTVDDSGMSLIQIMAPLLSSKYGDLTQVAQAYAISRRSNRLDASGKKVPITKAYRDKLEKKIRKYTDKDGNNIIIDWHNNWQTYNNKTIEFLKDTGVLTDETAKLWQEYSDYYPFYRAAEGKEGQRLRIAQKVFGNNLTAKTIFTELKGSQEKINMDMLEAISLNLTAAIDMGMRNVAQQRIARDLRDLGLAKEIPLNQKTDAFAVEFRVKGKPRKFEIYDPLVYQSMLPLGPSETVDLARKFLGPFTKLLRETIVRTPDFVIRNMIRDTVSASVTSGSNYIPVIDTLRGWGDGVEKLEKFGVVGGYDYRNDPENITKFFKKEFRKHKIPNTGRGSLIDNVEALWDWSGDVSTKSDAATRNAVYKDVLARTGNEAEAIFQAMEIINFSRAGTNPLVRTIAATNAFLNARVQGLDVFYRAATGQYSANSQLGKSMIIKSFITRASMLMGLTWMYYMLMADEDEYKMATDVNRELYWLLPNPWGDARHPLKIPVPFEAGFFFKTLPEIFLAKLYGGEEGRDLMSNREVKNALARGIGSTLEFNPIPDALTPLVEAYYNHSFFTQRPIVPYYIDTQLYEELKTTIGTTEIAKKLSEAGLGPFAGLSPIEIDHVVTQYTGSMGAYALSLLDYVVRQGQAAATGTQEKILPEKPLFEQPMIRAIFAKTGSLGYKEDFYDLFEYTKKVTGSMKLLEEQGRTEEFYALMRSSGHIEDIATDVRRINKKLAEIRKDKKDIAKMDMSAAAKRRWMEQFEEEENALLAVMPYLKRMADMPAFPSVD